jgi:hypothetical protein
VKRALLVLFLAGCGTSTAATVKDQLRHLTDRPQQSFENPGDALALSPTPDNGPFVSDPRKDCSTCPPR